MRQCGGLTYGSSTDILEVHTYINVLGVSDMRRIVLAAVIMAGILAFSTSCALNPPLGACFSSIPDPSGEPLTMQFSAACSTHYGEPLGVGYIYEWHFGDRQMKREYSSALTTYTYHEAGTYTVELLLIGWNGEMARARKKVEVTGS